MQKPRYLQIADDLIEQIRDGVLVEGSILPTEQQLQEQYQVSRVTIRKSMKVLVDQDLLYRVRGSGTYIKAPKVQHNAIELNGFNEEVTAQGKTPSSKIITFELQQAEPTIAQKLAINEGDEIFSIRRLRLINDKPEVLEHTYMPVALFPDLNIEVMRNSKYQYVEQQKGLKIKLSKQSAKPIVADDIVADKLAITVGTPILKIDAVGLLSNDQPFEYTEHYFLVSQYSFDFVSYRQG
ncbi:GntR family transcriptional regulator [Vibrio sp. SS-MA-C1-2]|uniref:GntR family transcriptional regulator n=1 Tax=Vibrio sp. SS-MA-C1-2 TaxID=2908646 RepID=UPI001F26F7B3|nr:GntR family transcriptional regulator [Vibrio sp. SS-MA-C1-2]UJF17732.1 GntR family transcriptional regulator [Vibrio sp. SS-MA-C1-2]